MQTGRIRAVLVQRLRSTLTIKTRPAPDTFGAAPSFDAASAIIGAIIKPTARRMRAAAEEAALTCETMTFIFPTLQFCVRPQAGWKCIEQGRNTPSSLSDPARLACTTAASATPMTRQAKQTMAKRWNNMTTPLLMGRFLAGRP
jgi:hypothetical protein